MQTILSYGMGVESSTILTKCLLMPSSRPFPLEDLIVVTAQTGDEYKNTQRDVEAHTLPLLRKHRIRYVQVARAGHLESDGITVLSDTREPKALWIQDAYKLSDELRAAGGKMTRKVASATPLLSIQIVWSFKADQAIN